MEFFLSQQLSIFLYAVVCGVIIGVINEPFRFMRYSGFNGNIDVFIQDIIFMSVSAVITFFFSLCYNRGEVRFFIIFGEIMGFLLFRYTIGLLTGKLFWLINFILKFLITTIKKVCGKILTTLTKISKGILCKIPLFNRKSKTSCQKGKFYCIMNKSVSAFSKIFIKR